MSIPKKNPGPIARAPVMASPKVLAQRHKNTAPSDRNRESGQSFKPLNDPVVKVKNV